MVYRPTSRWVYQPGTNQKRKKETILGILHRGTNTWEMGCKGVGRTERRKKRVKSRKKAGWLPKDPGLLVPPGWTLGACICSCTIGSRTLKTYCLRMGGWRQESPHPFSSGSCCQQPPATLGLRSGRLFACLCLLISNHGLLLADATGKPQGALGTAPPSSSLSGQRTQRQHGWG